MPTIWQWNAGKDSMERHQGTIDDYNNKHGLGTYHNKGRGNITEVINC